MAVIPDGIVLRAEDILATHLATYGGTGGGSEPSGRGLKLVGGSRWWRLRGRRLEGEWVEVGQNTGAGGRGILASEMYGKG